MFALLVLLATTAEVVYVEPGKTLRLRGGLGPLQEMAVAGAMTFRFEQSGAITQITLTCTVGGYRPHGLAMVAEAVDGVLRDQLERLADFTKKP